MSDTAADSASTAKDKRADIWLIPAVLVGALLVIAAARPLGDQDIWWHVRAGRLILDHGIPRTDPWSFTATGDPWVMTSWLSDVILALLHQLLGWRGIVLAKVVLSAGLLALLGRRLFFLAPSRFAAPVFVLAALSLAPFLAERTQLVSLLFVVWLAGLIRRVLDGAVPPWSVLAIGYAWANLHGMWILLPLALIGCLAGVLVDGRPGGALIARRCLLLSALTVAAAAITPVGPRLVYWPFVVRRAAAPVSEWQPTQLLDRYAVFFLLLVILWVIVVALSPDVAPRSELLWVLAIFVFALRAARDVAPAAILLAPFVCVAMNRSLSEKLGRSKPPRVSRAIPASIAAAALILTVGAISMRAPLVGGLPSRIVAELKTRHGPVRVLNSYGVGGYLTGEGAPTIAVAIDGRTDIYEPEFVRRYMITTSTTAGWRDLVSELRPDAAVLGARSQLAAELKRSGWREIVLDGDYVLLDPPRSGS